MAKYLPTMKSHPGQGCLISCPGWDRGLIWCKIWLELQKEVAGMHPPFSVSITYSHPICEVTTISDKMQTKTAQKETQDRCPRSRNLYTMDVFPHAIAKVVIYPEKSNVESLIDPLIYQPPHPDMLLFCSCFEFVPGVPVNGDDHLHPLVLRICRFPATPRSCTAPCLFSHIYLCLYIQSMYAWKTGFHSWI